ncbi:hypothetical protein [Clostridium tagluense]|uniref:Uncharacterized protein n=1 Tax=Clostridium tagluense TaxID=360422 RepID=A0A401UQD2_9CLOT|nr:hypothetical protein [Clostridium tagluense]GCD11734.1 hypothetical protein Ctaglu_33570 [Clostridium tagluense]
MVNVSTKDIAQAIIYTYDTDNELYSHRILEKKLTQRLNQTHTENGMYYEFSVY